MTPQQFIREVAERENVSILFAVESGSRAWGFESPDSDWDIRFIFARPLHDYLTITRLPNTIEDTKGDLDLAGWDCAKALSLMLNGNHTIREWLRSPIRYVDTEFITSFLDLASQTPSHIRLTYSYRSLLHKVLRDYLPREKTIVQLKKYFYAIRSGLVLEWLSNHTSPEAVPPMCLSELLDQVTISYEMRNEIDSLLSKKNITSELGIGLRLPTVDEFIFRHNEIKSTAEKIIHSDELIQKYNKLFLTSVLTHLSK